MGVMAETSKRKTSTPPEGYLCKLCQVSGHWIQQCPEKQKNKRRKKNSGLHIPIPGVDPSQKDIDAAKEYQKIPPPKCFCGNTSRLKKVKQSKANPKGSRAIGKYFFFCATQRQDNPCRFARLADDVIKELERKRNKSEKQKVPEESKTTNDAQPEAEAEERSSNGDKETESGSETSDSETSDSDTSDSDNS